MKMKTFVHLKVEAEGYRSGATEQDEVFLTPDIYEAIKDELGTTMWFHELDGKYSEQEEDIQVQFLTEDDLSMFDIMEDASGCLFDRIMDEFSGSHQELQDIQTEAHSYIQKETLTFAIRKKDKEVILEILHGMGYVL